MPEDRELIGHIVRLQVQTAHLKRGDQPHRWYDPAPITEVASLRLDDGGVVGIGDNGAVHHDVHHRDHPISRYRGENGVSVGFTSHYSKMRHRFGQHLTDGIAGENILIASDAFHSMETLGSELVVETDGDVVRINDVAVAAPCVEFTRFCLQLPTDRKPDRTVAEALQFLHNGMRGFYSAFDPHMSTATELRIGDPVYRLR